jgi:hypothetical protein
MSKGKDQTPIRPVKKIATDGREYNYGSSPKL